MVLRLRRLAIILTVGLFLYYLWTVISRSAGETPLHTDSSPHGDQKSDSGHHKINDAEEGTTRSVKLVPTRLGSNPQQSLGPAIPKIQHDFDTSSGPQEERLSAVKAAFKHSWNGYKKYAWLKDELAPATAGYRTTFSGWAAMIIDSLDTLWIMGMKREFDYAVEAIHVIDFSVPEGLPINVFETTIRYLGGLIGAYDLSNAEYPVLLNKAVEVGDMLLDAFNTPSKMPVLRWNKIAVEVAPGDAVMSELGSLSLEFIRLSQLTGQPKYSEAVQRITDCIYRQQLSTVVPGLLPTTVNARECDFTQGMEFSLGASIDSAYEYFPKTHQLLGGKAFQYREMYDRAADPINKHLLFKPMTHTTADILLTGTLKVYRKTQLDFSAQMQHLSCFAGGMFALASQIFSRPTDLAIARKLVDGCIWAANITPTGIMPESFHALSCADAENCIWDETAWGTGLLQKNSFDEQPSDRKLPMPERLKLKATRLRIPLGMTALTSREYKLRPEAIESMFVLYRITGDEALRDHAWTMFQAIVNQTKTEHGFSNIEDVTRLGSRKMDKMESYWTAETLKYFYLMFSAPDVLSLDDWVFNTEAHPFRLAGKTKGMNVR